MPFMGRRLLMTTLDPLPRSFRTAPGLLAINHREAEALRRGDGAVFKELVDICHAEFAAEVVQAYRPRRWKPLKNASPSARLHSANAIYRGKT